MNYNYQNNNGYSYNGYTYPNYQQQNYNQNLQNYNNYNFDSFEALYKAYLVDLQVRVKEVFNNAAIICNEFDKTTKTLIFFNNFPNIVVPFSSVAFI